MTTPVRQLVVTISWPIDPERGSETYGPFKDEAAREEWVEGCEAAADDGWRLLKGASYLLHMVVPPFDPDKLWENGSDAAGPLRDRRG